jgi:hypothetical protein
MANTFNLINSRTLDSSTGNIVFSAIPQTYSDLVLRVSAKGDRASYADDIKILINDSSGTYSNIRLYGTSGGTGSDGGTGASLTYIGFVAGITDMANIFGGTEFVFPNYADTNKLKSYFSTGGAPIGSTTNWQIGLSNGQNTTTAAITSITISGYNSTNVVSGSTFFLYGLKNN